MVLPAILTMTISPVARVVVDEPDNLGEVHQHPAVKELLQLTYNRDDLLRDL